MASTPFKQRDHDLTQQWDTTSRFTAGSLTITSLAATGSKGVSCVIIYYNSIFCHKENITLRIDVIVVQLSLGYNSLYILEFTPDKSAI